MRAGTLNKRITLEQPPVAKDRYNQPTGSWTPVATIWAGIEPVSGREILPTSSSDAQKMTAEATHKLSIRYRSGLSPRMRVKYGVRSFDILSIVNVKEANRELVLVCKEIVL